MQSQLPLRQPDAGFKKLLKKTASAMRGIELFQFIDV
jgi:hypothetical protein